MSQPISAEFRRDRAGKAVGSRRIDAGRIKPARFRLSRQFQQFFIALPELKRIAYPLLGAKINRFLAAEPFRFPIGEAEAAHLHFSAV